MIINLAEVVGEFCVLRTDPQIPKLREIITQAILAEEVITIDWTQVKILTPSFLDELLPPLMISLGGKEKVMEKISFVPILTGFLAQQLDRGYQLRKND